VTYISNTTVISNFASIGQLDLLHRLYDRLYISLQVYEEIRTGLDEGYAFYAGIDQILKPLSERGWLELTSMMDEEVRCFSRLPGKLNAGETSCLAIAKYRGWLFLTDDKAARREAQRLGIAVSGSVGSLVLAIDRGLCALEQANVWLHGMVHQGYHSPVADLGVLLQ
jgi:hypothetical protein